MRWLKWLPWRYLVRRAAHQQGFIDPFALLARLHGFAQPSEVGEPIELLRAGVVFHARGLINSRVIQHNLDWVWPYWIERQFDPKDPSFVPRAFSITHVNLTHRNWTAIGHPDCDALPIVDPRGLLTPLHDGWSLDGWLVTAEGARLLPSRARNARQSLVLEPPLRVVTECEGDGLKLVTTAWVDLRNGAPICRLRLEGIAEEQGHLVLALRPHNPEGVSFIHHAELADDGRGWLIDGRQEVRFDRKAFRHHVSTYRDGDVSLQLADAADRGQGTCDVGMVTAAALFPLTPGRTTTLTASIPLGDGPALVEDAWAPVEQARCRLSCPEPRYTFLFDAAVASLVLHSPGDVYPGPYTYKRFWFRDAAFIIHALLCAGLIDRARRALDRFPARQTRRGYFRSQEGEWDSNGQVLWILHRYLELTGEPLPDRWHDPVRRGARWIVGKRVDDDDTPHAGLLPAGFSAEHLGPNDYYYWDDFWSIAGLRAAAAMLSTINGMESLRIRAAADALGAAVDRSLAKRASTLGRPGLPASPYRRLDAGAIGSLAIGYPLQLCAPDDPRLLDCVAFLLERCFVDGAFYQDMIHSGLNAYLTLHVAQVLLRADDARCTALMDAVAAIASPTGQWPEAIHPLSGGGCMGDGHHVWASAEWVLMIRNAFVREEDETLVLGGGIPPRWLAHGASLSLGPTPTPFGTVSVHIVPEADGGVRVRWEGDWRGKVPRIAVRLPGSAPIHATDGQEELLVPRGKASA